MPDEDFKFVIVGGGTAGWLTALYVKKNWPHSSVTVIASSELGILGAGEGSTPHFIDFLKEIDITPAELVKHAKGTFKNGVKFTNWNNDGESYYRGLLNHLTIDFDIDTFTHQDIRLAQLDCIANGKNFDTITGMRLISDRHQIKYYKDTHQQAGPISMHFDANLLAKYLETVGLSRGVVLLDDEVIDFNTVDNKISGVVLKNNKQEPCNFIFDCSGLRRLIIGKFYNSEWASYNHLLTVNHAIPFFIKNDTNHIPPYTESIAMKHGWIWKIPVQDRFGCGYVFDGNRITTEEAKKEVIEYLGFAPEFPREFSFDAGSYDRVCIENCVAVGLSAGFTEPLEATSIWVAMTSLRILKDRLTSIVNNDSVIINEYNVMIKTFNVDIMNFLYFHYITHREDTEFWKSYKTNPHMPDIVEWIKDIGSRAVPSKEDFEYMNLVLSSELSFVHTDAYNSVHYLPIAAGNKLFSPVVAGQQLDGQVANIAGIEQKYEEISANLVDHFEYIKYLQST